MAFEPTSYSADVALAETLERLQELEVENKTLHSKVSHLEANIRERMQMEGNDEEVRKENLRLKKQNNELMHVNNQWDLEYKDVKETFRKYRTDSQKAQIENQATITKLKEAKEHMIEETHTLKVIISQKDKEIADLRLKVTALEDELSRNYRGQPMVSYKRMKELEEESQILRQQLKTYKDDFIAERKDRERMNEEKESATIRFEAEVTSLKLQLERCRNELAHYTAEANRLSQQLRLKSQYEEEQYKKHLESRGYITRSASGHLPPLDPFVEIDDQDSSSGRSPRNISPMLLTRGVDVYGNLKGAQSGPTSPRISRSSSQEISERSRSPPAVVNGNGITNGPRYLGTKVPSPSPNHTPHNHMEPRFNGFKPNYPPSMMNEDQLGYSQVTNGYANGVSNEILVNGLGETFHLVENDGLIPRQQMVLGERVMGWSNHVPPMETRGRYTCPRCERKFENKSDFNNHKIRCVV